MTIDHIFALHFGRQFVDLLNTSDPFVLEVAVPEREARGPKLIGLSIRELVGAACAEELQERQHIRITVRMLVVTVIERFGLHDACAPFEQTADLALQTRTGDVGAAGKRIAHNSFVNAANMHFSIASADMQTGEAAKIRTDRQDFGKFHGLVPT